MEIIKLLKSGSNMETKLSLDIVSKAAETKTIGTFKELFSILRNAMYECSTTHKGIISYDDNFSMQFPDLGESYTKVFEDRNRDDDCDSYEWVYQISYQDGRPSTHVIFVGSYNSQEGSDIDNYDLKECSEVKEVERTIKVWVGV